MPEARPRTSAPAYNVTRLGRIGSSTATSTSGNVRVDYLDLSGVWEGGDGVMSKVTVRAVGEGRSFLALEDAPSSADVPMILPGQGDAYPVELVYNATIAVGEPCGATPTPRVPVNQINPPGGTGAATPPP